MGTRGHRLSIEWSRIEPEPSVFSEKALNRYREILEAMHARDIEPMVTLHHFTNPIWFREKGDFDTDLAIDYFQRYTAIVVDRLGDLIPKWITINEPMVYFLNRYLDDHFPDPVERGWLAGLRAVRHMLQAHAAAYHTIKQAFPNVLVGTAKHIRPIHAWPPGNILDRWWAKRVSRFFNNLWLDSISTGRIRWPVGGGTIKHLGGSFDFVGINYYSRSLVRFPLPSKRLYETDLPPGSAGTEDGFFELYPSGLFETIKSVLPYRRPIYISENGLPDMSDRLRPAYILSHLREVWRAISFNYPVMGYYHWSLVDNFEWERGWTQRFGLIEVNPETQERTWRPSANLYSEICRGNCISSDMASRYAPDIHTTLFPGDSPDSRQSK